jgi:hypothetical protein
MLSLEEHLAVSATFAVFEEGVATRWREGVARGRRVLASLVRSQRAVEMSAAHMV